MPTVMEKEEAHKLVDRLPKSATWDDLMHEIYVREAIERGLANNRAGRTRDVRDVRAKYGSVLAVIHGARNVLHAGEEDNQAVPASGHVR